MINANLRYNQALAVFAVPGNRWQGVLAPTYWAVASGRCTEDVLDAVHALGIHDRDGDIRWGMESATAKIAAYTANQRPHKAFLSRQAQQPTTNQRPSQRVRQLIDAGKDYGSPHALRQLSPKEICPDTDWLARRVHCEMQLLAYFGEKEILHVFRTDSPMRGQPDVNLRPLGEWLGEQNEQHPDHLGEIVRPNPFAGEQGQTNEGKPSYIAQNCLSAFRHMVFEFDHLALEDQCRFWAGFIKANALPLVSLVSIPAISPSTASFASMHPISRPGIATAPRFFPSTAPIPIRAIASIRKPFTRSPEPVSPESSANRQAKSRNCSGYDNLKN